MLDPLRLQARVDQGLDLRAVASKRCLLRAEVDRPLSAIGEEIMPFRVMVPVAEMLDEGSLISPSYQDAARTLYDIIERRPQRMVHVDGGKIAPVTFTQGGRGNEFPTGAFNRRRVFIHASGLNGKAFSSD